MTDAAPSTARREGPILAWPAFILISGFAVPFVMLIRMSVAHRDAGGLWSNALDLTAYGKLADPVVLGTVVYSLELAVLVAAVTTALALPLTLFITHLGRRAQIAWLILLLATLCLSEVLVAFGWQIALSKRVGLSDLFVWLGLLDAPRSLSPSFGATICGLVYLLMPFSVLQLYPPMSRLDPELGEAARTMGAPAWRVFVDVILPLTRAPLISSSILGTVSTIGTYVTPSVLGRPEDWTIAVLIGQAALAECDVPFAAATAVLVLILTGLLTGLALLAGRRRAGLA